MISAAKYLTERYGYQIDIYKFDGFLVYKKQGNHVMTSVPVFQIKY